MKVCRQCRNQFGDDQNFCPRCGSRDIFQVSQQNQANPVNSANQQQRLQQMPNQQRSPQNMNGQMPGNRFPNSGNFIQNQRNPMQSNPMRGPMQNQVQGQMQGNPMQGNQMQGNQMQNQVQGNPMQRNPMQGNSIQGNSMIGPMQNQVQGNPMQGQMQNQVQGQMQGNPMQGNPMQGNLMQGNLMQGQMQPNQLGMQINLEKDQDDDGFNFDQDFNGPDAYLNNLGNQNNQGNQVDYQNDDELTINTENMPDKNGKRKKEKEKKPKKIKEKKVRPAKANPVNEYDQEQDDNYSPSDSIYDTSEVTVKEWIINILLTMIPIFGIIRILIIVISGSSKTKLSIVNFYKASLLVGAVFGVLTCILFGSTLSKFLGAI